MSAMSETETLVEELLAGKHRALARVITKIENRSPGYREIVAALHEHTGNADVVGITGSPGSGKSTLVDKIAETYRDQGYTVGVIAVDPSSPYTGGAVLGDRIRMASNVGDMDVFVRSMSARGSLGGLSAATSDAVKALDAFGKDKIIIETVGAGQNEVDVVRTADTTAVLVPPGTGDNVQMLKAGILEIADIFVVNKADLDGANRTVQELREMLQVQNDVNPIVSTGHHGPDAEAVGASSAGGADEEDEDDEWTPRVVETIATSGEGVDDFLDTIDEHKQFLVDSGQLREQIELRYAEEIRTLVREDVLDLLEAEIDRQGGMDSFVEAVIDRETDPYTVADDIVDPLADCLDHEQ